MRHAISGTDATCKVNLRDGCDTQSQGRMRHVKSISGTDATRNLRDGCDMQSQSQGRMRHAISGTDATCKVNLRDGCDMQSQSQGRMRHTKSISGTDALRLATLRQIQLAIPLSHKTPTTGRQIPAPTLQRQAPGR